MAAFLMVLTAVFAVAVLARGREDAPKLQAGGDLFPGHVVSYEERERNRDVKRSWIHANFAVGGSKAGREQVVASEWLGSVRGSTVFLTSIVGWCTDFESPRVDHVNILEQAKKVIITVYVSYPPPHDPEEQGGCLGVERGLKSKVDLDEPVGDRVLYDGARWPPPRRWPRL
ncbi:MAG TPA: hypothetical protein VHH14_07680 [Solirubrobacterales bacterium]|nr:hypothetical protein [Solirubrobacterales bacterium]